ncbi:MAG TPA: hypothetical protein VF179_22990 [Thermoanaerobaculia bacterium]|nr:hypothetical protein [Thermoanaerobaculia bacterium]
MSRRSGLPEHEAEEFRSWALFKLVEDDSRVLASWEGRSAFPTFLTVVLGNLMQDYERRRVSEEELLRIPVDGQVESRIEDAERSRTEEQLRVLLAPLLQSLPAEDRLLLKLHYWDGFSMAAISSLLGRPQRELYSVREQLCGRDGFSLGEAVERMRSEHGVFLSRAELERMVASLTRRAERRRGSEAELLRIPVNGQVESRVEEAERSRIEEQLRVLLAPLLRSLPAEDRLLLKLHYWDGLSVAAISPLLGRPQRELYSVRDKCLKMIRRNLEEAGLSPERVRALLGCSRDGAARPDP